MRMTYHDVNTGKRNAYAVDAEHTPGPLLSALAAPFVTLSGTCHFDLESNSGLNGGAEFNCGAIGVGALQFNSIVDNITISVPQIS